MIEFDVVIVDKHKKIERYSLLELYPLITWLLST